MEALRSDEAPRPQAEPVPHLLFLQASSIHERLGGIEQYLADLLDVSTKLYGPSANTVIVPLRHSSTSIPPTEYQTITVRPPKVSRFLLPFTNRFPTAMFQQAKALLKSRSFDFIVCGHISLAPLAYRLSRMSGVPYLCVAYGIEAWGGGVPLDEWAFRRAYGILSISRWTREILIERDFFPETICVVNPRLPEDFERSGRPKTDFNEQGKLRLLTVGRLSSREQYKGHDHVIDALYRLKLTEPTLGFEYSIVGNGDDKPRLETIVRAAGLEDVVKFYPDVRDRSQLSEFYQKTDLHVMPSRFGKWGGRWRGEGFGIVYLEAASHGVPSLAYTCGGVTDIVRNGIDGLLVEPDDIACLSRVLSEMHRRRRILEELGKNAFSRVMIDFTGKAMGRQWNSALSVFLSRRAADSDDRSLPAEPVPALDE